MTEFIGGVQLPPVSQEFLNKLEDVFQKPDVLPGMDRDTAMYQAGQAYVVAWIKTHAGVKQADPVAAQRAVVRYGNDA